MNWSSKQALDLQMELDRGSEAVVVLVLQRFSSHWPFFVGARSSPLLTASQWVLLLKLEALALTLSSGAVMAQWY